MKVFTGTVAVKHIFSMKIVQMRIFFSGPCFPIFQQNADILSLNLLIWFNCWKLWARKTSVFGHFPYSQVNTAVYSTIKNVAVYNSFIEQAPQKLSKNSQEKTRNKLLLVRAPDLQFYYKRIPSYKFCEL